ncbi:MAG: protein phosphatase 2C domain-containing protein [Pirellulaceae bacterium]|nr:protein phosphatase 2C domain-containing protein [Pirellulaceae bacterium]
MRQNLSHSDVKVTGMTIEKCAQSTVAWEVFACQHSGRANFVQQDAVGVGHGVWQRGHWRKHWPAWESDRLLLSVADGVSSSPCPERASRSLLRVLHDRIHGTRLASRSTLLSRRVRSAVSQWAKQELNDDTYGSSTTLASLYVHGSTAEWVNCGDSRIYRIRREDEGWRWRQLSRDHRVGNDPSIVGLTDPAHRDMAWSRDLLHCMTLGEPVADRSLHYGFANVSPGDVFVLYTDGVPDTVPEQELMDLFDPDADLEVNATRWWLRIMRAKAPGNFSFVFCRVGWAQAP